uniref:Uncharacterized protein n=1 Tax=viral metagenome TaxID=1070528 RepID=A0A6C0H9L9_9ZZZZ
MSLNTLVCSDPEGAYIHDIWKDNDDADIIVLGDIMDSTFTGLDKDCYNNYKKYNIRNLLFIRIMEDREKCTVLLGNRDLMKLKLVLLNNPDILSINSYEKLFEYAKENCNTPTPLNHPEYLLNLNVNTANDFLKNNSLLKLDNKEFKWSEIFNLLFGTVGAFTLLDSIYLELLDICPNDFKTSINEHLKSITESSKIEFKSCLIIILFKLMLKPRTDTESYNNTIKDTNISFDDIIHLLYDIFKNENTKLIDVLEYRDNEKTYPCIFSHGGITKYLLTESDLERINHIILKNIESLIPLDDIIVLILKELQIMKDNKTKSFTKVEDLILINNKLKQYINDCISDQNILASLFLLLILGTELVVDDYLNIPNNYFSPIGPGFAKFISNPDIGIQKNTIQFMGHKPVSIANSIYNDDNYIYICTDISNTFLNSKLNKCNNKSQSISKNYIILKTTPEKIFTKIYTLGLIKSNFPLYFKSNIIGEIETLFDFISTIDTTKSIIPIISNDQTSLSHRRILLNILENDTNKDFPLIKYNHKVMLKMKNCIIYKFINNITYYFLYLCNIDDLHCYICTNPNYWEKTPTFIIILTNEEHNEIQTLPQTGGSLYFNKYLKYKYKYLLHHKKKY